MTIRITTIPNTTISTVNTSTTIHMGTKLS